VDVQAAKCKKKPIQIAPRLASFRRRVVGQTITAVDRIGKRIVPRLEGGDAIVIEPRMTGLVLLAAPPNQEHLRLRFVLSGSPARELLYWDRRGLGVIRLVSPHQFDELYGEHKIGPDALLLSPKLLAARFTTSRRAIKVALLDQRAIAGVGNLYASEILFLAKIHPESRCDKISARQWSRMHAAMEEVLHDAIRCEGSTLSDGTYRNALNEEGSYQNHHRVYLRGGQPCPKCGALIERIVQAQRSTFFCPRCQRIKR